MQDCNYILRDDIQLMKVGDEIIIYDMDNKKAHVLNETAAIIIKLIEEKHNLGEIINSIVSKYNQDIDQVSEDCNNLIQEFINNEIVFEE